jgi:DNA-binding beta-propeller fold protein YncE
LPVVLLCIVAASPAPAQESVAEAQRLQGQAREAYQAGDYEGFARLTERALELNPASYATQYNLACGYARTGRGDEALDLLEGLTRARVDFGMASDPDLESLRARPRFQELVKRLEQSLVPVSNSTLRTTVEQLGLIPEGIAADRRDGRLFFGSMRTGDVYVLDSRNQLSRFGTLGEEGRRSAIGMTVDEQRNLLWVVGTHFFMAEGFDAEAERASGVFAFDLATGERVAGHLAGDGVGGLNDVAVAPSGDVYVSGSRLQVLRAGAGTLETVETTTPLAGTNGLAVDPGETKLFVSIYPLGLGVIDLESGDLRVLEAPPDTPLQGIDGLYWHEGDLVAIQNGVQPWRLLRLTLDEEATAVEAVRVIELANDTLVPMTGAILGDEIHYIGRAPAPEEPPSHFAPELRTYLGKILIMTAPLD